MAADKIFQSAQRKQIEAQFLADKEIKTAESENGPSHVKITITLRFWLTQSSHAK